MDSFVPNPRQAAAEGVGEERGVPRSVADADLAHAVLLILATFGALIPDIIIALHTDSLTSFYVLAEESANTPEGQFAMERFRALPEAAELEKRVEVDHTYGEGNVGDKPSRAKWKELYQLAAQLGVRVRRPQETIFWILL